MPNVKCPTLGLAVLLLILPGGGAHAQDTVAVKSVVNRFVAAVGYRQVDTLRNLTIANATIASVGMSRDGESATTSRTVSEFISALRQTTEAWSETVTSPEVRVDDRIAHLTGNYAFLINGTVSYCGRVTMILVKRGSDWRIAHIAETQIDRC